MAAAAHTIEQALEAQAASCTSVGSPLYATMLTALLDDYRRGGVTADLLEGVSARPLHDAVPLRYLATGHLLALTGAAPALAAHLPSCGGHWAGDGGVAADFLETVAANMDEFVAGVRRNVQTNEVGRAGVLAAGFALIAARYGLPLDQLEIGSSAGLLTRWDHYGYDTGRSQFGNATSPLAFGPEWWAEGSPDLSSNPRVQRRRASDISPIDISTEHGRIVMLSFIWPDQLHRVERFRAALTIAEAFPLDIEPADAGAWLARQLEPGPAMDVATVVFHSVVWPYLPAATRDAVRSALADAGARAGDRNPLCWLRMEPAAVTHCDLRLTTWPGGREERLAEVGFHGADIRWLTPLA